MPAGLRTYESIDGFLRANARLFQDQFASTLYSKLQRVRSPPFSPAAASLRRRVALLMCAWDSWKSSNGCNQRDPAAHPL